MKYFLILVAVVVALSCEAQGQTKTDNKGTSAATPEQAVVALTNDWITAEGKHDADALGRILADNFVATAPNGLAITKDMVLGAAKSEEGLSFTGSDIKARVFGDSAAVTGHSTAKGPHEGVFYFTLMFVKLQDRWQMVAAHISPIL